MSHSPVERLRGISVTTVPGFAAAACLAVVAACDLLLSLWHPSLAGVGPVDEPAHLATALLCLLALGAGRTDWSLAFLAATVAIDLDHLPAMLGHRGLSTDGPRPVTHSLATPLVLAVASGVTRGRPRALAAGAAGGVLVHLFRDVATGPGVPLLWPVTASDVTLPYPVYAAVLAAIAAWVVWGRPGAHPATRPDLDYLERHGGERRARGR